jgi:hypothetical protein
MSPPLPPSLHSSTTARCELEPESLLTTMTAVFHFGSMAAVQTGWCWVQWRSQLSNSSQRVAERMGGERIWGTLLTSLRTV